MSSSATKEEKTKLFDAVVNVGKMDESCKALNNVDVVNAKASK